MDNTLIYNNVSFKPCPHCGEKPELDDDGSCLYIFCCASMDIQKVDYLDNNERDTYSSSTYKFSAEVENKLLEILANKWNKRVELK